LARLVLFALWEPAKPLPDMPPELSDPETDREVLEPGGNRAFPPRGAVHGESPNHAGDLRALESDLMSHL
jgi:hypothetical protein